MRHELESYEHTHSGVLNIRWQDVMRICRHLVEKVHHEFHPEVVVGIGKGGVIPGAIIASMLRINFFPLRITRREDDRVIRSQPALLDHIPTDLVRERRILVTDDIVVTGDTLRVAVDECWACGATDVKTAALYVHPGGARPDWFGVESEHLIIQPWDALVFSDGRWHLNEEYAHELEEMGITAGDALSAVLMDFDS